MEKNDLLTSNDLIELTGSKTVKKQMEVLKKHSIKFITRTDGKIRTTWTAVNTVLQPQHHKKDDQEPNLDFLRRGQ